MSNMTKFNPLDRLMALSLMLLLSACGGDSSSSSGENPLVSSSDGDSTSSCDITQDQQEMLNQVNRARGSSRSCGDDVMPAVAELSWNCQLRNAAQAHSNDMASNNFFSHTGSDGLSVGDRVTASEYSWSSVGENIAAGQTTITQVMTGWLNSPGHCRNIMAARSTEFGSAVVTTTAADYSHYWTQVFASPQQ
jgi:uncharacterized protein YkwD